MALKGRVGVRTMTMIMIEKEKAKKYLFFLRFLALAFVIFLSFLIHKAQKWIVGFNRVEFSFYKELVPVVVFSSLFGFCCAVCFMLDICTWRLYGPSTYQSRIMGRPLRFFELIPCTTVNYMAYQPGLMHTRAMV